MKEVAAVDGSKVQVLTAEDLSAAKTRLLLWLFGIVMAVVTVAFLAGWRAAVLIRTVDSHEQWRPLIEGVARAAAQIQELSVKLDRAHNDIEAMP